MVAVMLMTTVTGIIVENTNTVLAAQKTLKVKNIKKPVRTVYLKMKPKNFFISNNEAGDESLEQYWCIYF